MQSHLAERLAAHDFAPRYGRVRSVAPGMVEASGPDGTLGELCAIATASGEPLLAEIVALDESRVLLSPLDQIRSIALGAQVVALSDGKSIPVGDQFAGRLLDALGAPIDGLPLNPGPHRGALHGSVPGPLERVGPDQVMATGVKTIDALLTLGRGQRVGIVAASGVGKTSLMEQLAFQADADHFLLCLVGERGREVEGLWQAIQARADRDRFRAGNEPDCGLPFRRGWRSTGPRTGGEPVGETHPSCSAS